MIKDTALGYMLQRCIIDSILHLPLMHLFIITRTTNSQLSIQKVSLPLPFPQHHCFVENKLTDLKKRGCPNS